MIYIIFSLLSKILLICTIFYLFFFAITYFFKFNFNEKRFIQNTYLFIIGLFAVSFLIFSFYAPSFISTNSIKDLNLQQNSDFTTVIYNLMSPFIAIAAAILTFMAFWVQHSANNEMLKNNEKQNVEKQFYEMLQIHKQNVKELQWENWSILSSSENNVLHTNKIYSDNRYSYHQTLGYKVFELHLFEYIFIEESLIKSFVLLETKEKIKVKIDNIETWKKIVSISYDIYMHGISFIKDKYDKVTEKFFDDCDTIDTDIEKFIGNKDSLNTLPKYQFQSKSAPLFEEDKDNFITLYLYFLLAYFKKNMQPFNINLSYSNSYKLLIGSNLFAGHYNELNRYYRHLYQTVKIVANYDDKIISYNEKRKFLRMLRAQLTNHEQLLLFYNWISGPKYGEDWEKINDNHFFTKYRMIHNLHPENSSFFINNGKNNVISWIKSFNPNYNDYDNHPLFEFENYQS